MDLGLKGKRALVLGASQGMGEAIARTLATEGCNVIVGARNAEKVAALAASIAVDSRVDARPYTIDLSDKTAVDELCARIRDEFKPDILLYNTGGPPPSRALGVDEEVWTSAVQSLLLSAIALCEAAVPHMREQKWGRILTIASSGVVQPIPFIAVSNTVRAGFAAFSKSLAEQVAPDGITVNMLLPGQIQTERADGVDRVTAEREGLPFEEVKARTMASLPAGRRGTVQEFADVATFMASENASYVTGSMIRIDGGHIKSI